MKHSIKKQLLISFLLMISGPIFACWFINVFFLEFYYVESKKQDLTETYHAINRLSQEGELYDDSSDNELLRLCEIYNISFIIADPSANIVKTSISDSEEFNQQLRDIIFARMEEDTEIMEKEDAYVISNIYDDADQMEYLIMWGNLENGNFFLLRTALEGIRDSVNLANVFLLRVGIGAFIVAGIIMILITKRITEPIAELTKLSEKMANLNFEARYQEKHPGETYSEIDVLGKNFNQMSEKLEETIKRLKKANLELEKDVENKTRVDNMRKEFLSNVSHELKTPIALIQGYAEGLKENVSDDPESRDFYLEVIMDETMKMNQLVKKLMTLNQLEFGGDIPEMERFDVVPLIRNFIQSAEILTKQNGIEVFFSEKEPIYVWADEYMVEDVFRNYFNNALQYVEGKKEIHVKIEKKDMAVRIGVFNTGTQIEPENMERIWDKFYKVDKARTRAYGGSGVGLSIVKAMMESMQQKYGVTNFDDGVEFWFELETK